MATVHSPMATSSDTVLSDIKDIAQFGIQNAVERAFILETIGGKKVLTQILDARLNEFLEKEAAIKAIQAYLAQQAEQIAEQEEKQEAVESLVEGIYQYKHSSDKNNGIDALDKSFKEFIKALTNFYHDLEAEHKEELTEEEIPENTDINNNLVTLENLLKRLPLNVLKALAVPREGKDELTVSSPRNEQKQLANRVIADLTSKVDIVDSEQELLLDSETSTNTLEVLTSTQQIILALEQQYLSRQRQVEERRAKWERALGKTLLYQHELDNYAAKYAQYDDRGAQMDICRHHRDKFLSQSQTLHSRTKHWEKIAKGINTEKDTFSVALNRYSPLIQEVMKRYQHPSKNNSVSPVSIKAADAAAIFGIMPGHSYKKSTLDEPNSYKRPSPLNTKLGSPLK
jgi:hypothetical protein